MIEILKQENFDDELFNNPEGDLQNKIENNRTNEESGYEIVHCLMCEDTGACNHCERGKQWIIDNPLPGSKFKKRNIRIKNKK